MMLVNERNKKTEKAVTYLTAIGLDVAQERGHVDVELGELFVTYVMMPR